MAVFRGIALFVAATAAITAPVVAQVRTVDPNSAIDADLDRGSATPPPPVQSSGATVSAGQEETVDAGPDGDVAAQPAPAQSPPPVNGATANSTGFPTPTQDQAMAADSTYQREDVLAAAEGVFGKGAAGLASMVEKVLKDQGRPNAYIAGREAGGALIVGVRYGSGVMSHKVEGTRKVFWTGPSVGFDVGGDANKVFVLVYNLYDSQELYQRFPGAEGRVFFVGGFAATYLRRGNIVLIPIRLGVGWRLGANVGYMKFTEKSKWLPF